MVQNLNLIELVGEVLRDLDVSNTIAIDAELKFLSEPSVGIWMPFHVDVEVVNSWLDVALKICISVLPGDVLGNKGAGSEFTLLVGLDEISDTICILVV